MPNQDEALLKELAGDSVGVENIDPVVPAPKSDPLEVHERPAAPAVSRMNAAHSTKAGGKGFAVTVRGEYFAALPDSNGKKTKKPYEVVVNLPSLDSALSVMKQKILDRVILAKHPESHGHRTLEIVQAVPLSPNTAESNNLQFMNRDRLERYVIDHEVPLKAKEYEDVVVLRDAVIDFTLNPKGFEEREAKKQADRKIAAELAEMNPVPAL